MLAGVAAAQYAGPALYLVAVLALLACGYIMFNLAFVTWYRFWVWSDLGAVIYFAYGYSHSTLSK